MSYPYAKVNTMMNKTSGPDWLFPEICECALPMCPECDPDFFRDLMFDLAEAFFPEDDTPPF